MKLIQALRKISACCVIVLYAILCLATLLGVASRVIPGLQTVSWTMEVSRYAMIYMVMLTNAVAIRERDEIIFEYVFKRLPARLQCFAAVIGDLLVLFFLAVMLVFGVRASIANMVQLSPALGLPITYVYVAMPLGAAAMMLEKCIILAQDLRHAVLVFRRQPAEPKGG